jgi:GDP-4-dehydro-6-deoxy-D-mannose reductase
MTLEKYLITGFSGFVSRYFCEYLEKNKINAFVKGIDIQSCDFNFNTFENIQVNFEKLNLLASGDIERVLAEFKPDYILHLASFSSVAASWKEPVESFQNNTNIFLNLVEALRKLNMKDTRILSVGSSEEYGDITDADLPLKEDHKINPISPYAVARVSQEYLSKIYSNGYEMDIVMTRSFNHIGPGQKSIFVVSSLSKQLAELKKSGRSGGKIVAGDVSIVRDFTDVRDVVHAYYLLLKNGKKGQIYNVCSGIGVSIKEVIDIMAKQLNMKVDINIEDRLIRPNDNRIIIGSNEKMKKEIGWNNSIPLEQSLSDILSYWESYDEAF